LPFPCVGTISFHIEVTKRKKEHRTSEKSKKEQEQAKRAKKEATADTYSMRSSGALEPFTKCSLLQ
jgi:hypothetical protein